MRYILEIDNPENVRLMVLQDLKELGIKVPKVKKNKSKEDSLVSFARFVASKTSLSSFMRLSV